MIGPVPQVRSSAYIPFAEFMEEVGASIERRLDGALVPAIAARDPEMLVPVHLAHSFLEKCARTVGLPNFGFVVGERARIGDLGAFGQSVQQSLTLHDALGKVGSKFALYSSAERVWWSRNGQSVSFFHAYTHQTGAGSRHAQQCALLLMRDTVRLAVGPKWQPDEVFLGPSQDASTMQQAFETEFVRPSKFSGIAFPAEFLSLPINHLNKDRRHGSRLDSRTFEATAPANDFAGSIKQVISALMMNGRCSLDAIAEALGMHRRTLQRHLSDSDSEFAQVLAEVRFEAAVRLLDEPCLRVIDIAYELGYGDPSNFTRAFRRWTGVSPEEFRRLRNNGH